MEALTTVEKVSALIPEYTLAIAQALVGLWW